MESAAGAVRKRRTRTSRRPRSEAQPLQQDKSPVLSNPLFDDTCKVSSDEDANSASSGGKMFNLNQCLSRSVPAIGVSSAVAEDGRGTENRLKKVKLKVGGVTRTIQAKSSSNGASGGKFSTKITQLPDNARSRNLISQENSTVYHTPSVDKKNAFQGTSWNDFSKGGYNLKGEDAGRMSIRSTVDKEVERTDLVRKSKRVPKRRVLEEDFDEDDDEIRYLAKLENSKITIIRDLEAESTRKTRNDVKRTSFEDVGESGRDARKSSSGDMDYVMEQEPLSDEEHDGTKKMQKDFAEFPAESKKELALTTRQRALLSKDAPCASSPNQFEFSNGLPPAPPRKPKEVLSEVEQQMKKAEAAQKRRMQNEKAARESEAEAIRKILGQESSRKKREEKMKKRQEELAQEKAASAQFLSSNTIRWVMGSTGTTVSFSSDMGLPKIFDSMRYGYPPPREKCIGPSCNNAYKYRDSKSNLPLCSLQCYKAMNGTISTEKAC